MSSGKVPMHEPQVSQWEGNQIEFRSALAIMPKGGKPEGFGGRFGGRR